MAHPLKRGYVTINEIGSNFEDKSYLEFFSDDGFGYDIIAGLFFGILILMPNSQRGQKRKMKIVAAMDLNEMRESPSNTRFFVLGNPDSTWLVPGTEYYGFKAIPPNPLT